MTVIDCQMLPILLGFAAYLAHTILFEKQPVVVIGSSFCLARFRAPFSVTTILYFWIFVRHLEIAAVIFSDHLSDPFEARSIKARYAFDKLPKILVTIVRECESK
jgi:hypothetical protein